MLHADVRDAAARDPVIWPDGDAHSLLENHAAGRIRSRPLVTPQAVTITATDGMRIPTQLFLPRDLKAGERRPALIFFHGGSRRQMLTHVALQLLLPQRLRDESVARQPGLHRAVGELSQRHRLRTRVPRGAELRRVGRRGVQRRDGRGLVSEEPAGRRSDAHRPVGRIVRRLSHRDGPVTRVRPVRRRRGLPRRARLEPGHPHVRARLQRSRRSGILDAAPSAPHRSRPSTPGNLPCC